MAAFKPLDSIDLYWNPSENEIAVYLNTEFIDICSLPQTFANIDFCPTIVVKNNDMVSIRDYSRKSMFDNMERQI